jgi:hypothetical protein
MTQLTGAEARFRDAIREKDRNLRAFLNVNGLSEPLDPMRWLTFLSGIKNTLGNINNDLGFIATLLVKNYLERRFQIVDFDAAAKAQGASGIDIDAKSLDGKRIAGELKTTKPYQPGFGANQRVSILKDLTRLATTEAEHRFLFVIDPDAFNALRAKSFASKAPGVEVVDLVSGQSFIC